MSTESSSGDGLSDYLGDCRNRVLDEIRRLIAAQDLRYRGVLYDLMLDYPLREAKALRPALSIAACRALGGPLPAILPTAAALELYHNAFLIHDDVEDGSDLRRSQPTLHTKVGVPIAINTADGMLALALIPLLGNTVQLGVGKALRTLDRIAHMARESAEGQALELGWVRAGDWSTSETDYLEMVVKKTCWYSFMTPLALGAIAAGAPRPLETALEALGRDLGIAFQIQDDVLNLVPGDRYGKEQAGDLWEGKHTLILIHALASCSEAERRRAVDVLRTPRRAKSLADVEFVRALIQQSGAIDRAREVARVHASRAREALEALPGGLARSVHREFLYSVVEFVLDRNW